MGVAVVDAPSEAEASCAELVKQGKAHASATEDLDCLTFGTPVLIRNFFFGSVIGMTPQLFVGASLGAGLNKVIENNQELPSMFDIILTPDIYVPIIGMIILVLIGFIIRKKFYK